MPIIDEIGITMTIDENRHVPDLTSNYLEMEPGHVYDVQLSVTETSRVESPYTSKCQNDYPATCPSSGAYTMTRCSQGCVDYHIKKACNCSDHTMTKPHLEHVYKTKKFCRPVSRGLMEPLLHGGSIFFLSSKGGSDSSHFLQWIRRIRLPIHF